MTYDMTDDLIRRMVERNHEPEEHSVRNYGGIEMGRIIRCISCKNTWPCAPIKALREWKLQELARETQENFEKRRWSRGLEG